MWPFSKCKQKEVDEQHYRNVMEACRVLYKTIKRLEVKMSAQLDLLKNEVSHTKTVIASAKVLILALAQKLKDAMDDPAELQALHDELKASADELAIAVSENSAE